MKYAFLWETYARGLAAVPLRAAGSDQPVGTSPAIGGLGRSGRVAARSKIPGGAPRRYWR